MHVTVVNKTPDVIYVAVAPHIYDHNKTIGDSHEFKLLTGGVEKWERMKDHAQPIKLRVRSENGATEDMTIDNKKKSLKVDVEYNDLKQFKLDLDYD